MNYNEQTKYFKKTFGLKNEPLAISFTNDKLATDLMIATSGRYQEISICRAIKLAMDGKSIIIDDKVLKYPDGCNYCGLTELTKNQKRRIQDYLIDDEKITGSIISLERMLRLTSIPLAGIADRIVITPLDKTKIRPDMLLFMCNPGQASRLISLDTYWDGLSPKQQVIGTLCYTTIIYTIMTGYTNISMGDWAARIKQHFTHDMLFVSIPYERINNLIDAMKEISSCKEVF